MRASDQCISRQKRYYDGGKIVESFAFGDGSKRWPGSSNVSIPASIEGTNAGAAVLVVVVSGGDLQRLPLVDVDQLIARARARLDAHRTLQALS